MAAGSPCLPGALSSPAIEGLKGNQNAAHSSSAVTVANVMHDVDCACETVCCHSCCAAAFVLGLIPFEWAAYTRWSWALQPAWYTASPVENALHLLFAPLKAAAWKLFEVLFPLHTATPGELHDSCGDPMHAMHTATPITVSVEWSGRLPYHLSQWCANITK